MIDGYELKQLIFVLIVLQSQAHCYVQQRRRGLELPHLSLMVLRKP